MIGGHILMLATDNLTVHRSPPTSSRYGWP